MFKNHVPICIHLYCFIYVRNPIWVHCHKQTFFIVVLESVFFKIRQDRPGPYNYWVYTHLSPILVNLGKFAHLSNQYL